MSTETATPQETQTAQAPKVVSQEVQDLVFRNARTVNGFLDKPVSDELLKEVYDLFKWGPNAFNAFPIRIVFLRTQEAKEKLKPALMEGNVAKTMKAPVVAIIAYDLAFKEKFNITSPHYDAKAVFDSMPALVEPTAFRNGTLLGAYFMIAARMKGLDVGPMSGFNNDLVDEVFFKTKVEGEEKDTTQWKSNFIVNLGYGDLSTVYPRAPRLEFEDACKVL